MAKIFEAYTKHIIKNRMMAETLRSLLMEKGVFTEEEWKSMQDKLFSGDILENILNEFERDADRGISTPESPENV